MEHKVLIIEDDDFLRGLIVTKLEKEGFVASAAIDGVQGMTELKASKPDLLILDLMLPNMTGFEVLKAMKADNDLKSIKVIIFSNLGEEKDIKECMDLGADAYMVKANFTPNELIEKIKETLK